METRRDIERLRYHRIYGKEMSSPKIYSSSQPLDHFQIPESDPPLQVVLESHPPLKVIPESDPQLEKVPEVDSPIEDVIDENIIPPTNPQQLTDSFSHPNPIKRHSKRYRTKNTRIFNNQFVEFGHYAHSNLGYEAELENCAFL